MPVTLLVDSTISGTFLGIRSDRTNIWSTMSAQPRSSNLAPLLAEGLAATSLSIEGIEKICVSQGPGSFTGIKIGLAFCYGLQRMPSGHRAQLGVSSLVMMASHLAKEYSDFSGLILPSTKSQVYLASGDCESVESIKVCHGDDLKRHLELRPGTLFCLNRWDDDTVPMAALSREQAFELSMTVLGNASDRADFTSECPSPQYIRLSTPEEKLIGNAAKEP